MSSPHADTHPVHPGGSSLQGPHRVEAFAKCPQLEAFAHELHLRLVHDKLATAVGTLVHAGLAYRYGVLLPQRPSWLVYADGYECMRRIATRPDFLELALTLFSAYEAHYSVNVWRPVLVEEQLVVTFPNGEPYSCRVDMLVDWGGRLFVVDHKVHGKWSSSMLADYGHDRQMHTNVAIARACGYNVEGIVLNVIERCMPTPKFHRELVQLNPTFYANLGTSTDWYLRQMKEVRERFPDPTQRPRNSASCRGRFGFCDFHSLCRGEENWHDFHVPAEYLNSRLRKGT